VLGEPGAGRDEAALADVVRRVARRAGLELCVPADARGHCCGMPFASKGYDLAFRRAVNDAVAALWRWSGGGRRPIVADASPCAWTLKGAAQALTPQNRERFEALTVVDGVEFAHGTLLPRLEPRKLDGTVALHPVCSLRKMELDASLEELARACAADVFVPVDAACCGFAGDRGFSHPELTAAALAPLAQELAARPCRGHYSSSRSCEWGLTRVTGREYRSFWHLLDEATV
jgi:D-lactate dehydrogenase